MNTPERRLIINPCRSGSTALHHSLAQLDPVRMFAWMMKDAMYGAESLSDRNTPDYSFYQNPDEHDIVMDPSLEKPFWIYRATFGPLTERACTYSPFRSEKFMEDAENTRPLVLLRDPIQTAESWHTKNWQMDLFQMAYKHVLDLLKRLSDSTDQVRAVTYKHLTSPTTQRAAIEKLLDHWGIETNAEDALDWKNKVGEEGYDRYSRKRFARTKRLGALDSILQGPQTLAYREHTEITLPMEVQDEINRRFREAFESVEQQSAQFVLAA